MPPAIIAAAVGLAASAAAAASIITLTTAIVITIGASVAGALLSKTKVPSLGAYTSQQERKQVLRSAVSPMVVIYGRTVVSGTLFFAEEEPGDQADGEWVHLGITIAAHEVNRVTNVWLGEDNITAFPNHASYEIHNNRTTADPFMLAKCPSWKADMIGKGICWARVSLKFDADKFPAGLPNITFEVEGRKIYNPRTKVVEFNSNAAYVIRDYYKTYCDVIDGDLNDDQFIAAGMVCEQNVVNGPNSENRKRYLINGSFDMTDAQSSVLDDMHKACAGEPTFMAGRHGIVVGSWMGQSWQDINEGQIISDIKIVPEAAYGEKLNQVTGTFLDPLSKYTETDFPPVKVDAYITADGGEFTSDLKLRFVSNVYQAQQLAQIQINRTRIGRSFQFTMNMSGYQYRPGSFVKLYVPQLGINGDLLRVVEWAMSADGGVDITLRQETSAVWDSIIGQPIERPDITDFPKGDVSAPINVKYTLEEIGEVVQGVLSWTNPSAVSNNLIYIRQGGKLITTLQAPGESIRLLGLLKGQYQLGIVAVGYLGQYSAETAYILNIDAPPMPSSVEVAQGFFDVTLKPKLASLVNVSTQFDFWTSGETKLPDANTATVEGRATRAGQGTTWKSENLKTGHNYHWYIRTMNAYGVSNFYYVMATPNTNLDQVFEHLDDELKQTQGYKDLNKGMQDNSTAIAAVKQTADKAAQDVTTLRDTTVAGINADLNTLKNTTVPAIKADADSALTKANANATAITKEIGDRVTGDQKTASDAANALLNESTERKAAITNTNKTVQDNFDSLSQQISQVSAGIGVQFDSLNIWYFDNGAEGWLSQGLVAPVITNGWIRPANAATSYLVSPDNLNVSAQSYAYSKMRVRKKGNSVWKGKLYWTTAAGRAWSDTNSVTVPEPTWDSNGIATIDFADIPWGPASTTKVFCIRLDIGTVTDANNYYELDWVAVGRPSPGAGMAALEAERKARTDADSAEALSRETLATQMRGPYTGTDIGQVTQGLLNSEKQARITADQAEVVARQNLESKVDTNKANADQSISTLTTKTDAQATQITNLRTDVDGKASQTALNALDSKVTTQGTTITSQGTAITKLQNDLAATNTEVGKKATAEALNQLTNTVTQQGGQITSQGNSITQLTNNLNEVDTRGNNLVRNYSFENDLSKWNTVGSVVMNAGEAAHEGSKFPWLGVSKTGNTFNNSEVRQTIRLQGGRRYRLTMWVCKTTDYVVADASNAKMGIMTTGNSIVVQWFYDQVAPGAGWVQGSVEYALQQTQDMIIYCRAVVSAGRLGVDDIYLEDITDSFNITATNTALSSLDSKVTTIDGKVTAQGQSITKLQTDLAATNSKVNDKADSSALAVLDSKVTQQGRDITTQGSQITELRNSYTPGNTPNNLLQNPGFEGGLLGWFLEGDTGKMSVEETRGRYKSSPRCLVWDKPSTKAAIIKQFMVLKAGRRYRLSCWTLFSDDAAGVQWGNTNLRLGNADTGQIIVAMGYNNNQIVTGGWTETVLEYLVPAGSDINGDWSISAFMSTGQLRADEVTLTDITDVVKLNATSDALTSLTSTVTQQGTTLTSQGQSITNLNNAVQLTNVAGSNLFTDMSFNSRVGNGTTNMITTDAARTGTNSLRCKRVRANGAGNEDIYLRLQGGVYMDVRSEQEFYIEAWIRRDPNETATPLPGSWFSIGLHFLSNTAGWHAWPQAGGVEIENLNETWVKASGYIKAPLAATKVEAWFSFPGNAGNVQGVSVLMDDVVVMDATEARMVQKNLDATSSAVTALTSRVDKTETDIASQSQQYTKLDNRITNIATSTDNLLPNSVFTTGIELWGTQVGTGNTVVWANNVGELSTPGVTLTRTRTDTPAPALMIPTEQKVSLEVGKAFRVRVRARSISGDTQVMLRFFFTTNTGSEVNTDKYANLTVDWATYDFDIGPITSATNRSFRFAFYKHTTTGVIVVSEIRLFDITDALNIDATSTALTSLTSTVTQQGKDITSQGTSITSLQNSVQQLGTNKADASAVTALSNRVKNTEDGLATQSDLTTSLKNGLQVPNKEITNQLANGSFEMGSIGWSPEGNAGDLWRIEPTGGASSLTPSCLSMNATGNNVITLLQYCILKAGRTYRVRCMAKYSSGTTSINQGNSKLRLDNDQNQPVLNVIFVKNNTVFFDWQSFEDTWTVPAGADQLGRVSVGCQGIVGGFLYVDDVVLEDITDLNLLNSTATAVSTLQSTVTQQGNTINSQGSAITQLNNNIESMSDVGANLVANSRFLKDTGMWDLLPQTGSPVVWGANTGDGKAGVTITRGSNQSPAIRTPSGNKGWPVMASRRYRITVRAKGTAGTYNMLARLHRVSLEGAEAYEDRTFILTNSWTNVTYDYAATPADIDRIYLSIYCHPANGTIVIDTVTLFDITDMLNNSANAGAITALDTRVTKNATDITAQATAITQVDSKVGTVDGRVTSLSTTVSNNLSTTNQRIDQVKSTADGASAGVQTLSNSYADLNGKINASWGVKVETETNGVKTIAGIQLNNGTNGSEFLIKTDKFIIYNTQSARGDLVFYLQNGQTYIRDAFINNASITSAKIADEISSDNYHWDPDPNKITGWALNKKNSALICGGTATIRGNILADNGYFRGSLEANNGFFNGEIRGGSGWFNGSIYARNINGDVVSCSLGNIDDPSPTRRRYFNKQLNEAMPFDRIFTFGPINVSFYTQNNVSGSLTVATYVNGNQSSVASFSIAAGRSCVSSIWSEPVIIPANTTPRVEVILSSNNVNGSAPYKNGFCLLFPASGKWS